MKPRFLLIAQPDSYRIAPYLKAARRLGLEVLIASRGKHSLITEVHAGIHIDLDKFSESLTTILRNSDEKPFCGILGSDDSTVELAAAAAEKLGLPHNPPAAARLSQRKDLARAHLALTDNPVPVHNLIDLTQDLQKQNSGIHFPCVIKPLNMSASRGVIRADTEQEFYDACARIKPIIETAENDFERSHVLVEDYIDGIEVAYEGYLDNSVLHTLALFDKPDPLTGPFFEETIYVTPSTLDDGLQKIIKSTVEDACRAYGLITGPIHAELRIDRSKKAWILEVASRTIGGDCARTLDSSDGLTLEALTIKLAIGEKVPAGETSHLSRAVMMIPIKQSGILKRTEGILGAQKIKYIDSVEIVIPNGHELIPLPEGNQYLGYIFSSAPDNDTVIKAIRDAYDKLKFVVAPVIKLTRT